MRPHQVSKLARDNRTTFRIRKHEEAAIYALAQFELKAADAVVFDFGDFTNEHVNRDLINLSMNCIKHGIFAFPFPVVAFCYDFIYENILRKVCVLAEYDKENTCIDFIFSTTSKYEGKDSLVLANYKAVFYDDANLGFAFKLSSSLTSLEINENINDMLFENGKTTCWFILFLNMLLNSDGITTEKEKVDAKLNKSRIKQGKKPIAGAYRVVIKLFDREKERLKRGGSHATPRLHWRRGHIRNLQSGKKTLVRPCVVGAGETYEAPIMPDYEVKTEPKRVLK